MKTQILPLAKLICLGVLLALVVLIPASRGLAQDTPPRPDQPQAKELNDPEELENFLDSVMSENLEDYHVPGATVSVVKDGELFFAKGYGYANLEDREPVVADETLFHTGSVGKPFTATAVMQLVEEGKLDLNADVNTYLEDFEIPDTYPQPITLHHLLTHTAASKTATRGLKRATPATCGPWANFSPKTCPPGCARPASSRPIPTTG